MDVLRWILEAVFWVLLILGQAPAAAALWVLSLPMSARDVLGPALRALFRPGSLKGPMPSRRRVHPRSDEEMESDYPQPPRATPENPD